MICFIRVAPSFPTSAPGSGSTATSMNKGGGGEPSNLVVVQLNGDSKKKPSFPSHTAPSCPAGGIHRGA
jgi:hypothetical protein